MRTGNDDHAEWNNEPPKDDFPYDKPDVHSYRIWIWRVICWLALAAFFMAVYTAIFAAGWYWKHGGW